MRLASPGAAVVPSSVAVGAQGGGGPNVRMMNAGQMVQNQQQQGAPMQMQQMMRHQQPQPHQMQQVRNCSSAYVFNFLSMKELF